MGLSIGVISKHLCQMMGGSINLESNVGHGSEFTVRLPLVIEEHEIPLLFQAFQKLSTKTTAGESSTGLGLAICKRILDAHQGKIAYKAAKQGGSRFYFQLPLQPLQPLH